MTIRCTFWLECDGCNMEPDGVLYDSEIEAKWGMERITRYASWLLLDPGKPTERLLCPECAAG